MSDHVATPLYVWAYRYYDGSVTETAKALGVDRSTFYRVVDTAYVIEGRLYTIKRTSK